MESFLSKVKDDDIKLDTIGDISKLPEESLNVLNRVKERTKDNK
jgi:undecaprenyl pyrophosphate synthase